MFKWNFFLIKARLSKFWLQIFRNLILERLWTMIFRELSKYWQKLSMWLAQNFDFVLMYNLIKNWDRNKVSLLFLILLIIYDLLKVLSKKSWVPVYNGHHFGVPILGFCYLWTTTTCQQQPQIRGPEGGSCTQVLLYLQFKYEVKHYTKM